VVRSLVISCSNELSRLTDHLELLDKMALQRELNAIGKMREERQVK